LHRRFRVWRYGVGHSQLLLRSPAGGNESDAVHVLFEGVRAVKLRTSYHPLTVRRAAGEERERVLAFAEVPERLHGRMLCLTLPSEDEGFIVCGRATVLTMPGNDMDTWWPENARVLHQIHPVGGFSSGAD
jgi:hypothetical protein